MVLDGVACDALHLEGPGRPRRLSPAPAPTPALPAARRRGPSAARRRCSLPGGPGRQRLGDAAHQRRDAAAPSPRSGGVSPPAASGSATRPISGETPLLPVPGAGASRPRPPAARRRGPSAARRRCSQSPERGHEMARRHRGPRMRGHIDPCAFFLPFAPLRLRASLLFIFGLAPSIRLPATGRRCAGAGSTGTKKGPALRQGLRSRLGPRAPLRGARPTTRPRTPRY